MRYKKTDAPIDQIGRELGVEYVLRGQRTAGSRAGPDLAELIQVRTRPSCGRRLRAGAVGISPSRPTSRGRSRTPSPQAAPGRGGPPRRRRPVDPEAYEAYLKGSQHWIKMTKGDLDTAEAYFDMALRKTPLCGRVRRAGLGLGLPHPDGLRSAERRRPRTREAPSRPSPSTRRSPKPTTYSRIEGLARVDIDAARPEWKRALELDPSYPDGLAMYSHFLAIMGGRTRPWHRSTGP